MTERIEMIVNNELRRAFYGDATVAEAVATTTGGTGTHFPY
jgi:hypothetical protein